MQTACRIRWAIAPALFTVIIRPERWLRGPREHARSRPGEVARHLPALAQALLHPKMRVASAKSKLKSSTWPRGEPWTATPKAPLTRTPWTTTRSARALTARCFMLAADGCAGWLEVAEDAYVQPDQPNGHARTGFPPACPPGSRSLWQSERDAPP